MNDPKSISEWIEFGRKLSLNPGTNNHEKGRWIKENGYDKISNKVERSNALKLFKIIKDENVDISECPHNRPTGVLQWLRDIKKVKNSRSCLYILKNEAFPSYLKIGISQTDFNRRLVGLNRESALPFPFEIVHIENFPGHQLRNAESLAHKLLKNYRVNKNREFFQVSPEIAVNTIKKIKHDISGLSNHKQNRETGTLERSFLNNNINKEKLNIEKFYKRIDNIINNIHECSDLISFALVEKLENIPIDRIKILNESIKKMSEIFSGELSFDESLMEGEDVYMMLEKNPKPPLPINADGQGCIVWDEEIWDLG